MKKIKLKINKILREVYEMKGFGDGPFGGCLHCPCGLNGKGDACCRFGCDVDKESYELMLDNREEIEKLIGRKLELCFEKIGFIKDKNFLGGGSYRSKTREDGFCVFHNVNNRGCALVKLVLEKKVSWRMVPTICKIYPLSWNNGVLGIYNQLGGSEIEKNCDCIRKGNKTVDKLWKTQKKFIDDLFDVTLL